MPKRSKEYMAARRNHILDAALQCYLEQGFNNLSVADICKAAGISMGALYKHFKTKREIILALADRNIEQIQLVLFPNLGAFEAYLRDEVLAFDTPRGSDTARANFQLIHVSLHDPELRQRSQAAIQGMEDHLEEAMKDLQKRGEINREYDVTRGARTLNMLISGIWLTKVVDPGKPAETYLAGILAEVERMSPPSG